MYHYIYILCQAFMSNELWFFIFFKVIFILVCTYHFVYCVQQKPSVTLTEDFKNFHPILYLQRTCRNTRLALDLAIDLKKKKTMLLEQEFWPGCWNVKYASGLSQLLTLLGSSRMKHTRTFLHDSTYKGGSMQEGGGGELKNHLKSFSKIFSPK